MDEIYFVSLSPKQDESIVIDDDNFHHITRVMRKQSGDILHITNGAGYFFECEISAVSKHNLTAKILKSIKAEHPLSKKIHFLCGNLKNKDRFEWMTEKLGELGMTSLTPLQTERSVKQSNNTDRLSKIAVSALKQSKNAFLLTVNPIVSLSDLLRSNNAGQSSRFFLHEKKLEKSLSLKQAVVTEGNDLYLFVGPEGGFSDSEIELFLENGLLPIWLGEQRFRTETAVIVSASVINQALIRHD